MKKVFSTLALVPLLAAVLPAQRPWQQITVPSVRDVAANFKAPPHEYGAIQPFLSWNGGDANERKARIVQDLDRLSANGIFVVNVSPGRGVPMYLTPEHMDQMKFVVQEAKKRGMKMWLQDESDYPSGFAGGKISQLYPQLGHAGHRRRYQAPRPARPDGHACRCRRTLSESWHWRRHPGPSITQRNSNSGSRERPVQVDRAQRRHHPE
jgi:hypothetical protein